MLKRIVIGAAFVGGLALGSCGLSADAQVGGYGRYAPIGRYGNSYSVSPGREIRAGGQHPRSLNYARVIPNTSLYPGNWRNNYNYGYGYGPSVNVIIGY